MAMHGDDDGREDGTPGDPDPGYGYWYGPQPPPPRRRRGFITLLIVIIIAAATGAGLVVGLQNNNPAGAVPQPVSPGDIPSPQNGAANAGTLNTQAVANAVNPGIVNITAQDGFASLVSAGTGIVLSADGLVLTNNHVIDQSTKVSGTLAMSGKTYGARVVGYDAADDVALIQLTGATGLKPVAVGNSDRVKVGEPVLALGNAEGQGGVPTVAPGHVIALGQTISPSDQATGVSETLHGTIQTNAQIQQGDSGGPLANAAGQVIGMNTAASSSQSFGGSPVTSGFAIPINKALAIARQIASGKQSGNVHVGLPGFIGIQVTNTGSACSNGATGPAGVHSGALICNVYQGTPGAKAGLTAGDVITNANGQPVPNASTLIGITSKYRPGTTVTITYVDSSGASHTAKVTLTTAPAG